MKAISVRMLLNDPEQVITVCEELEETEISYGDMVYPLLKPISVSGAIKPVGSGILRFDGTAETAISMNCARCLTPVDVPIVAEMSQRFAKPPMEGASGKNEDFSLDELDAELIDQNDRIDLEDIILYEIKLSIPMKVLCKEDCKGLCPNCGQNLNEAACSCNLKEPDPRWDALKGLSFDE